MYAVKNVYALNLTTTKQYQYFVDIKKKKNERVYKPP